MPEQGLVGDVLREALGARTVLVELPIANNREHLLLDRVAAQLADRRQRTGVTNHSVTHLVFLTSEYRITQRVY